MADKDSRDMASLPWPAAGDRLFAEGPEWWHTALLHLTGDEWTEYIGGYRRAADVLTNHVRQSRFDNDWFAYPLVLCWRQYLELRLKYLIMECQRLLDENVELYRTHDLSILWRTCRPLLERTTDEDISSDLDNVGSMILELQNVDPTSDGFRYPVDRKSQPTLVGLNRIGLSHFSGSMTKVANVLDAAAEFITVSNDYKDEMASEYGP
jgi:hypothetical protein